MWRKVKFIRTQDERKKVQCSVIDIVEMFKALLALTLGGVIHCCVHLIGIER